MPSLNHEKRLWSQGLLRVVGVDEVGMAALAGPVVAAACLVTPDTRLIRKVNDSKVLTRLQREDLISRIRGRVMKVGIGAASVAEIHRLNIYHASHVAMLRALRQIGEYDWVLVDGRRILDPAFAPGRHTEIASGDQPDAGDPDVAEIVGHIPGFVGGGLADSPPGFPADSAPLSMTGSIARASGP